jgi:hypothetical protein
MGLGRLVHQGDSDTPVEGTVTTRRNPDAMVEEC